jgi:hypothetical protein
MPMLPLVLSSDAHVFEPPDLWRTRIDRAFRDRAPRIERIEGGDYVVVESNQVLSGMGLISNAGIRFETPETISADGTPASFILLFDLPEFRFKLLQSFHQTGQVVFIAELSVMRSGARDAIDVARSFELSNVPPHLARTELQAIAEGLHLRVRLAVGLPPIVREVH